MGRTFRKATGESFAIKERAAGVGSARTCKRAVLATEGSRVQRAPVPVADALALDAFAADLRRAVGAKAG